MSDASKVVEGVNVVARPRDLFALLHTLDNKGEAYTFDYTGNGVLTLFVEGSETAHAVHLDIDGTFTFHSFLPL